MAKSVQHYLSHITRSVTLAGVRPLMFDRYAGDNKTQLSPDQRLYLTENGTVIFPAENIMSFLSAQNTESACKRFAGKGWRAAAMATLSFVEVAPMKIPILRDGKPLKFDGFDDDVFWVHSSVARLAKGIPNPKSRPVISLPWEIRFELRIISNPTVDETFVSRLFEQGGAAIGLGTYRGVYGKFVVSGWDAVKEAD